MSAYIKTNRRMFLRNSLMAGGAVALSGVMTKEAYGSSSLPASERFDLKASSSELFRNVALDNVSALQSFAFDNINQYVYTVQVTNSDSNGTYAQHLAAGDLTVTKLTLGGSNVGYMKLLGFGHGVQIGVEPSGTSTYLWTEGNAQTGGSDPWGNRICRFKFSNVTTLSYSSIASSSVFALVPNSTNNTCAIDPVNNNLALRFKASGASNFTFNVYDLDAVKAGTQSILASVSQPSNPVGGDFQGYTIYGSFLYMLTGNAYSSCPATDDGNTYITCINLADGTVADSQLTKMGYTLDNREPEGMAIQIPDITNPSSLRLCSGISSHLSCSNTDDYASIYYKSSLISA